MEAKRKRASEVMDRLERAMPDVRIELDYRTPLELLVAVILSAQCTDKRVNLVTPALFQRFPDAHAYARASTEEVEPFIQSCGLFRAKAKSLVAAARALVAEHGGEVPRSRALLEKLPGVGRKTAGVVCIHLGGDDAFPVDTHVKRLAYRLGFSRHEDPDKVERDMQPLLPPERWETWSTKTVPLRWSVSCCTAIASSPSHVSVCSRPSTSRNLTVTTAARSTSSASPGMDRQPSV
jgi:endonuclease-3